MAENERISNEAQQRPDSELIQLISDSVSRDSRRYPCRFNTENE